MQSIHQHTQSDALVDTGAMPPHLLGSNVSPAEREITIGHSLSQHRHAPLDGLDHKHRDLWGRKFTSTDALDIPHDVVEILSGGTAYQ